MASNDGQITWHEVRCPVCDKLQFKVSVPVGASSGAPVVLQIRCWNRHCATRDSDGVVQYGIPAGAGQVYCGELA